MIKLCLTAVCDGCGTILGYATTERTGLDNFKRANWQLRDYIKSQLGMESQRAYRPTQHFCQECADGTPNQDRAYPKLTTSK